MGRFKTKGGKSIQKRGPSWEGGAWVRGEAARIGKMGNCRFLERDRSENFVRTRGSDY